MAGFNGRELTFDWDSTTLVGVRSRTLSITHDLVDVTTDDDSGWRTLLADPGLKAIEVTLGLIISDEVLLNDIMTASNNSATLRADLPSSLGTPGNLSGTYVISSLEYSGEHDGAVEVSVTFMSSGAVTYTASTA